MSIALAANLSLLFPSEESWELRCQRAAHAGFKQVEILFPYELPLDSYVQALKAAHLQCALINTPASDHKGLAAVLEREKEFQTQFRQALDAAQALGSRMIHVMAGCDQDGVLSQDVFLRNIEFALRLAEANEVVLTLEALNQQDVPGYFYSHPEQAAYFVQQFQSPFLRLQFDFYHSLKQGLSLESAIQQTLPFIGHVQWAGVHGRAEPLNEQVQYMAAVEQLLAGDYAGLIGCEYKPLSDFEAGLGWLDAWLDKKLLNF